MWGGSREVQREASVHNRGITKKFFFPSFCSVHVFKDLGGYTICFENMSQVLHIMLNHRKMISSIAGGKTGCVLLRHIKNYFNFDYTILSCMQARKQQLELDMDQQTGSK